MLGESKEIALSLSGGGVRALGYHLGTMDYLNRLGWLERVTILSSVSGGSIVGIGYALAKKKQFSFEKFYRELSDFVVGLDTMREIFEKLSAPKPVVASMRRDLITGWAEVFRKDYFEKYFGDPMFGIFWDEKPTHLKEVMFNATEMKTGVAFRFQYSDRFPDFKVGNDHIYLDHEHAKKLKMSDVMASSACIPGGMEPLQFPDDYHWPGDRWDKKRAVSRATCDEVRTYLKEKFKGTERIALVDGGVYDNQTISSVLLALCRGHEHHVNELPNEPPHYSDEWLSWGQRLAANADHEGLGLYIISDAPVRHDPMYEPDAMSCVPSLQKPGFGRLTISQASLLGWVVSGGLLVSAVANLIDFMGREKDNILDSTIDIVATLIPGLVALLILLMLLAARRAIHTQLNKVVKAHWSFIKGLTIGNVWDMVSVRAKSLQILVSRFFLSRIRQLEYQIVGDGPFEKKIVANEIFSILDIADADMEIEVSDDLRTTVHTAANMPTKLWIDTFGDDSGTPEILRHRNDFQVLVAAGQATIILNLMVRDKELGGGSVSDQLREDWKTINAKPFHFVDQHKPAGTVE